MNKAKSINRKPLFYFSVFAVPVAVVTFLSLPGEYKSHIYKYYMQVKQRSMNKYAASIKSMPVPLSYISAERVEQKLAQPAAWAEEQIASDFATYTDVSKQNVQATFDAFPANKWVVMFTVKDGKLTVQRKDYEMNGAQTRGLEIYTNIFDYMAKKGYVKDVSFLLRLSDLFVDLTDLENFNIAPILTTAKDPSGKLDRNLVLVPDFMSLEDIPKFAPRILYANKLYPWEKKDNKVLWRGGHADVSGYRQKIVEYSESHPESMVDARWADDKNSPYFMLPEDQVKAKFVLNVDGHGPAWTRPIWQLLSNSVMVKQQSDLLQWYYNALQPDAHYIVTPLDPADLEPTLSKYTDEQLQTIAMNGHEFAKNNLLIDDMVSYLIMAVQKYEQLQNGQ